MSVDDNEKDDYIIDDFGYPEITDPEVFEFIKEHKDNFYNFALEDYIKHLPPRTSISETGVYTNDKKKQWEYWIVAPNNKLGFFSSCSYSQNVLGFSAWLEELEHYIGFNAPIHPNEILH